MRQFHTYFHPYDIIKLLCKYRVQYARNKHKLHLLADISSSPKVIHDFKKNKLSQELSTLLPPRRSWLRPKLEERKRFNDSQKLQKYSILKTIKTTHIKAKDSNFIPPEWYIELDTFIKRIQDRINSMGDYPIANPNTKPIKKEKKKNCKECRPISIYGLEDRVIIGLTAKYFTETFDDFFSESSFAFRAIKRVEDKKVVKTHHDAIEKIFSFHLRFKDQEIYAAECDIQKFFDCVNHQLVIDQLDSFSKENNIEVNSNARHIFIQYLESYSFSKDVYPKNGTEYFRNYGMEEASFKWPVEELRLKYYNIPEVSENLDNLSVGVPQGGALSCFISNLLLHYVDNIVSDPNDENLLYLRFCDDMVILHTDQNKCNEALDRYQSAIKDIKLLIHQPKELLEYSKEFWGKEYKSKRPYKWASNRLLKQNVPWLSFVGYQIKYDSSIRIRKKSLEKEINKQKEECKLILKALERFRKDSDINQISKKSKRQQLFALENRLISMSVGRIRLFEKKKRQSLCWTNGFKSLNVNKTAAKQLSILDKNRTKNLYLVKKELEELIKSTENPDGDSPKNTMYFGGPFSYYNFINKDRESDSNPHTQ